MHDGQSRGQAQALMPLPRIVRLVRCCTLSTPQKLRLPRPAIEGPPVIPPIHSSSSPPATHATMAPVPSSTSPPPVIENAQSVALAKAGQVDGSTPGLGAGKTFSRQSELPKLPIPKLTDTANRYLSSLSALQAPEEHAATKQVVERFLAEGGEGAALQKHLEEYASGRVSYIEEFWDDSYLQASESVVLNLNPFFILEDDPTPSRGSQLMRSTSLILASLAFIHDLRTGTLEPDAVRGTPLDMYQ